MKGYISNGICYIFPQEVAQIPEVEADFYYVQQEDYAAWVTANESLADKIVKYNFNILAAKAKPFAGHTDDNLEPAQKEDPELAWSAESATAQIGETNTFPTLTNPHSVTVSYTSSDGEKATIDASTGEITLVSEGNTTISAVFAGDDTYEAQTVTYTLTVQAVQPTGYNFSINGNEILGKLYVTFDDAEIEGDNYNWTDIPEGTHIIISNSIGSDSDYGWDPLLTVDGNGNHCMNMPAEDTTIVINYVGGGESGGSSGESDTPAATKYLFSINEDGNEFLVGEYAEGDNVQYTFNHALQQDEPGIWHWEYTMSPASLVNYNFSPGTPSYLDESDPEHPVEVPEVPAEISFIMPADTVTFTITRVYDEVL